jgi:hypothetical protein
MIWRIALAVWLASVAVIVVVRLVERSRAASLPPAGSLAAAVPATHGPGGAAVAPHAAAPPTAAPAAAGPRAQPRRAAPDASAPVLPQEALDFLQAAASGEPSGIALFPPPGTDPPRAGIVVPEDFELPPGYVRHYQVTDDGNPLPAILMFHPDYEWVDASGRPLAVPENRIVPPELAPPGLPVRMLEVPPTKIELFEGPEDQAAGGTAR